MSTSLSSSPPPKSTDLSHLIRPTPDPTAPSTPTGLSLTFYTLLSRVAFWSLLPWTILRVSLKHAQGHYPAWQSRGISIRTQVLNLFFWAENTLHLPSPRPDEWRVPKQLGGGSGNARRGVGVERVVVPPVGRELVRGVADVPGVAGEERPGWMLWPEGGVGGVDGGSGYKGGKGTEKAKEGERMVLYLHAGVYLFGHPLETGFAWNNCKSLNVRLLALNYRKTLTPSTSHPGPLLDALAAYLYLSQTLSFPARSISIIGDSAGAHLALLLTRYIAHLSLPSISLPGTLLLSSPWSDFTVTSKSTNPAFPSQLTNDGIDFVSYIADLAVPAGMRHYTPAARASCWFSPALATAQEWEYLREGGTRVYLMYGTKELLADEVKSVYAGMRDAGVDVVLREDIDGLHIGPTMRWPGSNAWNVWIDDIKTILQGGTIAT